MKRLLLIAAALAALTTASIANRLALPVIVGGEQDYDACGSSGTVEGLNPHGDGFLAVKAGPGLNFERIDKLYNGMQVYICGEQGDWFAIVYSRTGSWSARCNVYAMAEGNALHRAVPFRMGAPPLGRLARWMNCLARQRLCVFASNQRRIEFSKGGGCPHLARRLSGPALECMRERAHLMKAEQPRNLGNMKLAVVEVTPRQIAPQLLQYFSEIQPFFRKLSSKGPLAHS
jgi:hypothetical protein